MTNITEWPWNGDLVRLAQDLEQRRVMAVPDDPQSTQCHVFFHASAVKEKGHLLMYREAHAR